MSSLKLAYEDWFYHTYHLADRIEHAKDCKVCCWHVGLNQESRHIHGKLPEYIKRSQIVLDTPSVKV